MSEVDCPQCGGDGSGGNNEFACGMCNGSGGVPRPQPSAEPVAWLYALGAQRVLLHGQLHRDGVLRGETGWTETPLYPASALEAARREALDEAAKVADEGNAHWRDKSGVTANKRESRDYETMAIACVHVSAAIRNLKENPNAG